MSASQTVRALLICALCSGSGLARAEEGYVSLLRGKLPASSQGVRRAAVLSDGSAARDGAYWKTRLCAVFYDVGSFVEYDLGAPQSLRAAWLQGDNNDSYRIEGSLDGRSFTPLWDALPVSEPGLQPRSSQSLSAQARYVRVRPLHGDGNFSLSELQLFSGEAAELPPIAAGRAPSLNDRLRDRTLIFGLGLLALLLVPVAALVPAGRRWLLGLGWAAAAYGCWSLAQGVWDAWPVEAREVALLRGTLGFVGAAAVAREVFSPARWPAARGVCLAVLGMCALLGMLAFYNLGHPQFWNPHQGRWSFAHSWDLRQYYPTAKYFRELSYFRIYDADLAAYAETRPQQERSDWLDLAVRDLETFDVVAVRDRLPQIAEIKRQFTPERWAAYKADAEWFRRSMGDPGYLDTLVDYGGNATPVWMAIAHVLFSWVAPSDSAFTWTGLIDLALLAACFAAILRTFGLRSMLACALVFGANDFVMYGTNWSGATLRHDWLAYLGLGVCALRREHWLRAGAWLGLATMIRAFPLLALLGVGTPALLRTLSELARTRRLPNLSELRARERATLHVALGALLTLAVTAALSVLILGPAAWSEWLAKVAKIESDPHPASVALRNLIAGSENQARVLAARWPLYAGLIAL